MSCTTTYPSQGLPNLEVLDGYKKKFVHLFQLDLEKAMPILMASFDLFGTQNVHIKRYGMPVSFRYY